LARFRQVSRPVVHFWCLYSIGCIRSTIRDRVSIGGCEGHKQQDLGRQHR